MSAVIQPTIGRVVWFYPNDEFDADGVKFNRLDQGLASFEPMKADIAWVHTDEVVNLRVVDHIGIAHAVENVRLVQELKAGDGIPAQNFCTWMPYQKVQAAKTDEAAKGNVPLLSTQSKQHRRKLIVEIMRTHGSNVTADQLIEMATALDGWVRGEAKP